MAAYRHGLRASEVCDLQWQQIELSEGRLHVHRVKNGIPSVHPIRGDEMEALRKLRRDYPKDAYAFVSERGGPISPIGFHRLIQRPGEAAKMPFPIRPHMLRHGFKLANDGHDTRTFSTPSGTPKWRPTASRTLERLLRPALAARPNRRVHMLKQSVRSFAPELLKLRRGRQCPRFGRPLYHLGVIAGTRREHLAQPRKRRV